MSTSKKETYSSFIQYIEENQNRFYYLAYSYVKDPDSALDIVQEAVYKGLKSIDKVKEASYIKTWFYRILVNASMDELRRSSRSIPSDPAYLFQDQGNHSHDEKTPEQAELMDLYQALNRLDPKSKAVITLRYFEDMKLTEVAKILGENVSSIKSRLYRSLAKLKIQLEGDVFHDESEKQQ
ncbi:RNA polymerase sigma factor [Sinanaerobacter chloroacetimidivorans]|jgi:RNA polymerase sigma-70 factor (ECF subfamily)|uniref:Sigma-70 family RNA polymerase sigma factor n=1 Tax=Sinanaerobacter chloroacetimidivorans TaxID=2818044 RepID=A0A8J8B480_9FIRM|nr:sigma-70 family RNA polymerase sigma factor [Sinanaerobacter chloroacetimidivorans]MBR0599080.1 sigma-70 family RNA polymerase sigma factor [Sinanaerobacter chloroacetimidivorans]